MNSARRKTQLGAVQRTHRVESLEPRLVLDSTVVFNEIAYHPADPEQTEWIELYNQMSVDMDLSEWRLADGMEFEFPDGTILPGGQFLVIAADPARMSEQTGLTDVLGPFNGRLSNGGDSLRLLNNSDREMDAIQYEDRGEWPVGADGSGATLAKVNRLTASTPASNWIVSSELGGTPGRENFPTGELPRTFRQFVGSHSDASFFVPTNDTLGSMWTQNDFQEGMRNDSWTDSSTRVGFSITDQLTPYDVTVLADNPVGYWRLAEGNHDTPAMNLGLALQNADGDLSNEALFQQPSLLGEPNDFAIGISPNADDAMMVTQPFEKYEAINEIGGTGISIEFWLQIEELPNSVASLVGDGDGAIDFGFMVYLTPEGNIKTFLRTTSGANFGITSTQSELQLPTGRPVHIVSSWDQPSGQMTLSIDGIPSATTVVDGALPTTGTARNSDNRFHVGRDRRNAGKLAAIIDEVAVYNYALSSQRAAAHAAAGAGESLSQLIHTDVVNAMHDVNSSVYLRVPFSFADALTLDQLALNVRYDDGFVAYLNGTEVARRNAPEGPLTFNSRSTIERDASAVFGQEVIDLADHIPLITQGNNVLGIHGLNVSANDESFLLSVDLVGSGFPIQADALPPIVFNEIASADDESFQVELFNDSNDDIDVTGFELVVDGEHKQRFVLPPQTIAGNGYLVISGSELGFDVADSDRLFLYMPGSARLVDAQNVTRFLQGRSMEHAGRWLTPSQSTFGAPNQFELERNIMINEIMYHGAPDFSADSFRESDEEWIELFNRGQEEVDLSGWKLGKAIDFVFSPGTRLEANSYLVVSNDAETLSRKYPDIAERIVGNFSGRLNDFADQLQLIDSHRNPVDEVHYFDGGRWPEFADGGGASMELVSPWTDNSVAESWQASDESSRSQWRTYTYRGEAITPRRSNFPRTFNEFSFGLLNTGQILIDDIHVVEDPDGEALEFIQNSTFSNGTESWRPVGNHHGEIVDDPDTPNNPVLFLNATGPEEHLQNHVETTLKHGDTFERVTTGKEYEISFRAKWLAGSPQVNTRLFFNFLPRTTILQTPLLAGTPGRQNSRFAPNVGPTFNALQHAPIHPEAGEQVAISIHAEDPDGIAQMKVFYSVDELPFEFVDMTKTNDGRFLGLIPGQADRKVVQFYVEGTDMEGTTSTFPQSNTRSRALYQVGPAVVPESDVQRLQILLTDADEDFIGTRTNLMSNDRLGATVIYDDQVFYDVGVRLKGSEHGRPDTNRRGFSIRFHPDNRFRGVHETIGIDRSGGWRFGRTFGQDEILIHQFFNRAGDIPSMHNDLIYVDAPTVREGTAILQLARFNDVFLESQFQNGSDGTAYEYELIYAMQESRGTESLKAAQEGPSVVGIPVGTDLGDDKEFYRHYFLIENNRQRDDFAPMIRLAKTFRLRGDEFEQAVAEVLDVDQWLRAFAAMSLSGANDNYNAGSQHNAIFYERPEDGKMLLFPFDLDFAFHLSSSASLNMNPDLRRLIRNPNYEHAFLGHLHHIMTKSFNEEYMSPWVAHYEELLPTQRLTGILSWIRQRQSFVQRSQPDELPFRILEDEIVTDSSTVTVSGDGWINVRELRFRGTNHRLDTNWTTATSWQAEIAVGPGTQVFDIDAFDFDGTLIATQQLTVTSAAQNPVQDSLRITELNYNPGAPLASESDVAPRLDNDDFEFVELKNIGDAPIQLLGSTFVDGIDFSFTNTVLQPGEYGVVVSNAEAFQLRYGSDIRVLGEYTGRLNNGGERLALADAFGNTILTLTYNDDETWPSDADGSGYSLVLITEQTPIADLSNADRWQQSSTMNGSPGFEDPRSAQVADFTLDGRIDAADIDLLCREIREHNNDLRFDLTSDGAIGREDLDFLVRRILNIPFGDANLDGVFDSQDFVHVFQFDQYEDGAPDNSGWEQGDWNCDGEFSSRDLVAVFQEGNYAE